MAVYENNNEYASKGVAGAGLGLGIAGTAIGLLGAHGGFGGLFGNAQDSTIALAQKDAEIALLKAGQETDKKLVEVYNALFKNDKEMTAKIDGINARVLAIETAAPLKDQIIDCKIATAQAATNGAIFSLQGQVSQLMSLTALHIPSTNVCPLPMPKFNSWTAPTAETPVTGG